MDDGREDEPLHTRVDRLRDHAPSDRCLIRKVDRRDVEDGFHAGERLADTADVVEISDGDLGSAAAERRLPLVVTPDERPDVSAATDEFRKHEPGDRTGRAECQDPAHGRSPMLCPPMAAVDAGNRDAARRRGTLHSVIRHSPAKPDRNACAHKATLEGIDWAIITSILSERWTIPEAASLSSATRRRIRRRTRDRCAADGRAWRPAHLRRPAWAARRCAAKP